MGSFLNVVVYRLPAGKNLAFPGSFCPKCKHPIRWYDNVPVFGWLSLRGKCRDCGEPISFRYPLVEAITAGLFFGLAWIELLSGGANLPTLQIEVSAGRMFRNLPTGELVGIYAFHLLLLTTLLSAALIEYDRERIPRRLFIPALLVGAFAASICPALYRDNTVWNWHDLSGQCVFSAMQILVGLIVGFFLGWFVSYSPWYQMQSIETAGTQKKTKLSNPQRMLDHAHDGMVFTAVCISLFLGAKAIVALGAIVFLLTLLQILCRRFWRSFPTMGPILWMALLVLSWIVFWRQLTGTESLDF